MVPCFHTPKMDIINQFSGLTSASLRTWVAGLQRELPNPACWQGAADTASGQTAQPCATAPFVSSRPLCQPVGGSLRKIEHTYLRAHPDSCTVVLFCYGSNIRTQRSSEIAPWHASLLNASARFLALNQRIYWEKYKLLDRIRNIRTYLNLP